jgi:hypothetical protein
MVPSYTRTGSVLLPGNGRYSLKIDSPADTRRNEAVWLGALAVWNWRNNHGLLNEQKQGETET